MPRAARQRQILTEEEFVPSEKRVAINSSNFRIDPKAHVTEPLLKLAIEILKHHPMHNALTLTTTVPSIYMQQFWLTITKNTTTKKYTFRIDNREFELGQELFRAVLQICPRRQNEPFTEPPQHHTLVAFIKSLGYDETGKPLNKLPQFLVARLSQPWRTILSVINKCITGKDTSLDKARQPLLQIFWGLVRNANVDYAELIWEEFEYQIKTRKNKKAEKIPYPRYTKLIIDHFLSGNNDIAKRSYADMHSEADDELMRKVKVAVKGETIYGMQIPDVMLNDDVKKSLAYKRYLAKIKDVDVPQRAQRTNRNRSASVVRKKEKGLTKKGISTISSSAAQALLDLQLAVNLSENNDGVPHELSGGPGEGSAARLDTNPTRSNQKQVRRIITKAKQRNVNSIQLQVQALTQQLQEQKKRLDNFMSLNVADTIDATIRGHVRNEVKNHLPKVVPEAIAPLTIDFTIPQMKAKLLDMMSSNASSIEGKRNLIFYNALINSVAEDERVERENLKKRPHDHQDPPENREGRRTRRSKNNIN